MSYQNAQFPSQSLRKMNTVERAIVKFQYQADLGTQCTVKIVGD
jgi:hypothetical protein